MKATFVRLEQIKKELTHIDNPPLEALVSYLKEVDRLVCNLYEPASNPVAATIDRGSFGLEAHKRLKKFTQEVETNNTLHPLVFVRSELLTMMSLLLVSMEIDFDVDAESFAMTG